MMPDNIAAGMLETFLRVLVRDPKGPLWRHACDASSTAQTHTALADRSLAKSRLHTWLAWQEPPGLQLHDAVKQRVLDPIAEAGRPFVAWFRDLFQV